MEAVLCFQQVSFAHEGCRDWLLYPHYNYDTSSWGPLIVYRMRECKGHLDQSN